MAKQCPNCKGGGDMKCVRCNGTGSVPESQGKNLLIIPIKKIHG